MLISSKGYILKFIQTHPVKDKTSHLKSYVFKFFSISSNRSLNLTTQNRCNVFAYERKIS